MGMIRSKVTAPSISTVPMVPCTSGSTVFGDHRLQPPALVEGMSGVVEYSHADKKVKKIIGR